MLRQHVKSSRNRLRNRMAGSGRSQARLEEFLTGTLEAARIRRGIMERIRTGLIGAGFVGPLHIEAARRLGFVEIAGVAASSLESARKKAEKLNIERAYGSYEELLADRSISTVHICTPNYLHHPIVLAALRSGKHVICDKPLAMTSVEAREMRDSARKAGLVNAVTFNYRFNPLVQQARSLVAKGDLGEVRFVHGCYLQGWLIFDTDF